MADDRLSIELVAQEPQVDSPVAISWDADGRMYVAEMIDYPAGPPAGRVRLLEDRDADGRYEHAGVFAPKLNFPNGVLAAQGGVFVTAAPDLLFLKDANGDGLADQHRVVLTGFNEGNQQLRANGLTWGLDNWIYGANGRSDGQIRRPNDPPEKSVSLRAHDFRFSPDGKRFEATSGQSQFGQASDDWGNRFLGWNTIPIRQAVVDQAFLDRNPRLGSLAARDIADPADSGQVFPLSPRPQTFNRERTDFFNAMCGLTIFRGDALGTDYLGSAFVGESLTNLVHRRQLTPEGATFISRRAEHGREFLAAKDPWFHPVYMTTGPDGALYIVDFYRRWVEHPQFVAEALRGNVDWREGSGHGRIWRVSRRENTWPPKPPAKLSAKPSAELVQLLNSPNGWQRDTAQRLLFERADAKTAALLRAVIAESRLPQAKLPALALLESLGQLDDGVLLSGMEDGDARVRQFAIRLAAPRLAKSPQLREATLGMIDFPSPLTRFQAALALADIQGPEKIAAFVKLADLEASDPLIPRCWSGAWEVRPADSWPNCCVLNRSGASSPRCRKCNCSAKRRPTWLQARTSPAGRPAWRWPPRRTRSKWARVTAAERLARGWADRGLSIEKLRAKPPAELAKPLTDMNTLLTGARAMAAADDESLDHRLVAIEVLGLVDQQCGPILLALLSAEQPQPLQTAAAGALARADAETATAMFAKWQTLTISTRRALVAAALRSPVTTSALIGALEEQTILPRELDPTTRDALLAVREPALEPRIKKLLVSEAAGRNRQEVIARYSAALERTGDRTRGATCSRNTV